MAGAELFFLPDEIDVEIADGFDNLFTFVADNDDYFIEVESGKRLQQMPYQRFPSDGMQDLGQIRFHPFAFTGGEDDGGFFLSHGLSGKVRRLYYCRRL